MKLFFINKLDLSLDNSKKMYLQKWTSFSLISNSFKNMTNSFESSFCHLVKVGVFSFFRSKSKVPVRQTKNCGRSFEQVVTLALGARGRAEIYERGL